MSSLGEELTQWWHAGHLLMPIMAMVGMVLYTLLAQRVLLRWWVAAAHARQPSTWSTSGVGLTRALTTALPLLGLVGTVSGMVDTFSQLALAGGPDGAPATEASAGIALALTTTQYGMALAIPALVVDWLLARSRPRDPTDAIAPAAAAVSPPSSATSPPGPGSPAVRRA